LNRLRRQLVSAINKNDKIGIELSKELIKAIEGIIKAKELTAKAKELKKLRAV
jgi:hypothetical protein